MPEPELDPAGQFCVEINTSEACRGSSGMEAEVALQQ